MIAQGLTQRTAIRDAVLGCLMEIDSDNSGRYYSENAFFSTFFEEETQCKGFPTFCVVLTDEELTHDRMQGASCEAKLMVIVYARSEEDPRKRLDEALEDVVRAMADHRERLNEFVERMQLLSITTDEATRLAKPFAQAVMTWSLWYTRRMSFNG